MKTDTIVRVGPDDVRNFRIGMTLAWPRWYQTQWWHRRLLHFTRWWRPRTICTAVDVDNGIVTYGLERWSWRRWRWERE